ncbi:MAG TPA: DUF2332 family protein [Allosphingosinicella sp.]
MPGSATEQRVRAAFAEQAGWAEKLGSPFMVRLTRLLGERLERTSETGRRVLDWAGDPRAGADNVPLRLCGGLHALVRGGALPGLAAFYPPHPPGDEEAFGAALEDALREADEALLPWLDSAPQTNEVGRSAVLMAGLLAVADMFPLPMQTFELGASAGLNTLLDLYAYDLGGLETGDPESPLRLVPEWKGPPPPAARVRIEARSAVDFQPMDVRRDRDRLLAYVWPDQPDRIRQLEAALAVAERDPPHVGQGDAADWLESKLAAPAAPGRTRIVLHSIAFQYFPQATQARIAATIARAGAEASASSPLAWLRFEFLTADGRSSLRLRTWPSGEDRLLAWAHPHGKWVGWMEN